MRPRHARGQRRCVRRSRGSPDRQSGRRAQLSCRSDEKSVQGIGERRSGNGAGIDGDCRRQLRQPHTRHRESGADLLFRRGREAEAAGCVEGDHLEDRCRRDADRLVRLTAHEQVARASTNASRISFDGPDPRVRVEQEHASVAVDVVAAFDRIEGPLVLQHRPLHRAKQRLSCRFRVRHQLRDGTAVLGDDVLRPRLADAVHQLQARRLEISGGDPVALPPCRGLPRRPRGPLRHDQNVMTEIRMPQIRGRPARDAGARPRGGCSPATPQPRVRRAIARVECRSDSAMDLQVWRKLRVYLGV